VPDRLKIVIMRGTSRWVSIVLVAAMACGACDGAGDSLGQRGTAERATTTTTVVTSTTTALVLNPGGGSAAGLTAAPGEGGDAFCAAVSTLLSDVARIDSYGDLAHRARAYDEVADLFEHDLGLAIPAELAEDAAAFVQDVRDVAALARSAATLERSGDPRAFERQNEMDRALSDIGDQLSGEFLGPAGSGARVRFDNAFLAWMSEPCGPKPLETEVDEMLMIDALLLQF